MQKKYVSRCWYVGLVLSWVMFAVGCSEEQPKRATVKGMVTVDGKPVEEGAIRFCPAGTINAKPVGTEIVNGAYEIPLEQGPLVGTNRVEIQAFRKTGRKLPDLMGDPSIPNRPLIEEKINFLPPKYNIESSLVQQIDPGENYLDFSLKAER